MDNDPQTGKAADTSLLETQALAAHDPDPDRDYTESLDHFATLQDIALAMITSQSETIRSLNTEETEIMGALQELAQTYRLRVRDAGEGSATFAKRILDDINTKIDTLSSEHTTQAKVVAELRNRIRELEAAQTAAKTAHAAAIQKLEAAQTEAETAHAAAIQKHKAAQTEAETAHAAAIQKHEAAQTAAKTAHEAEIAIMQEEQTALKANLQAEQQKLFASTAEVEHLTDLLQKSQETEKVLLGKIGLMKQNLQQKLTDKYEQLKKLLARSSITLNESQRDQLDRIGTFVQPADKTGSGSG